MEKNKNSMKEITITEKEVKAAFDAAKSDETKKVLTALFCKSENKSNMDDYTTIKSYEDACEALGEKPILNDACGICGYEDDGERISYPYLMDIPKHIIALLKMETISRALWGKDFNPKPDSTLYSDYYYPSFALYTKKEIEDMSDKDKSSILYVSDGTGAYVAFGITDLPDRHALGYAPFGFRLCQETEEKAMYFGQQFIELWAEYLAFNFTTGERIKIEL